MSTLISKKILDIKRLKARVIQEQLDRGSVGIIEELDHAILALQGSPPNFKKAGMAISRADAILSHGILH